MTFIFVVILIIGLSSNFAYKHPNAIMRESRFVVKMATDSVGSPTIAQLRSMSIKESLGAICGPKTSRDSKLLIDGVSIKKSVPGPGNFIIANPRAFIANPKIASLYGLEPEDFDPSKPLTALANILPIIYIADVHPEYGTVGFMLHKESGSTMGDLHPGLKRFRPQTIYLGGTQNRGSSFTMVHQKVGFPENRAWKQAVGPGGTKMPPLFFSPDIAMANELCLTDDAKPEDFKFFQWGTIWQPGQLTLEHERQLWVTLDAPLDALFLDNASFNPMWRRMVLSLPDGVVSFPTQ